MGRLPVLPEGRPRGDGGHHTPALVALGLHHDPAAGHVHGLEGAFLRVDPPLGREVTVFARERWSPLGGAFVELMRERRWRKPPRGALSVP